MITDRTQDIASLFNQVADWSHKHGWTVQPEIEYLEQQPNSREASEKHGFRLLPSQNGDRIHFEYVGIKPDGTEVVEMYAWPTLVRVRLLHKPGEAEWEYVTDAGIPFHWDWNENNFVRLVEDMLAL